MTRWTIQASILLWLGGWAVLLVPAAKATTYTVTAGASIGDALQGALPGDIVLVECGIFHEQDLAIPEGVTLKSESGQADCVTILTDGSASALLCFGVSSNTRIEGIIFNGDPGSGTSGVAKGGGMFCSGASPVLVNCRFEQLTATYGGAVFCDTLSSPTFENCVFRHNEARAVGGALACVRSCQPSFTGCLVVGNTAGAAGAAFNAAKSSLIRLDRCTVTDNQGQTSSALAYWNASADLLALTGTILADPSLWIGDAASHPRVDCSNIYSDGGPIPVSPTSGPFISEDPMFCTSLAGDHHYNLDEASPCTPEASPACGGMGAMPVGCAMSPVEDPPPANETLPLVTKLRENYPNPFNPRTTIKYDVSRPGHVSVAVFDLAGRLVNQLVDEPVLAGSHQAVWHGNNQDDRPMAAGVYFVRLKTADSVDTRRMTLVK